MEGHTTLNLTCKAFVMKNLKHFENSKKYSFKTVYKVEFRPKRCYSEVAGSSWRFYKINDYLQEFIKLED